VRGDPLLLLGKLDKDKPKFPASVLCEVEQIQQQALQLLDPIEQTAQRLYSRLVTHCLSNQQQVPLNAADFYRLHSERQSSEVTVGAD